ncbi:hypothetical protein MHYP_G00021080 [Metynnis hypsauchen]
MEGFCTADVHLMVTSSAREAQLQIMAGQWNRKWICSEQSSAEAGCRRRSEGNIVEEEEGCGLDLLTEKRMELLLTASGGGELCQLGEGRIHTHTHTHALEFLT